MNTASANSTSVSRGLPNLPPLSEAVERQLRRRRTWVRRLPIKLTAIAALAWTSLFASKPAQAQDASCYFNWASQYDDQGDYDRAIANYTMAISLCPSDQVAYNNRGYDWWKKGQFDKAIADYNQALALCPNYGAVYSNRGVAWDDKGEHDRAAADFAQAIAVDPNVAAAYNNRGTVEASHQQFAQAKADYYRALSVDPNYGTAYENLAFFQATCPDPAFRDGQKAFANASQAYQLAGGDSYFACNALAAAYAECGDFAQAATWQQKTIDLAPAGDKAMMTARLEQYKQHKPYRSQQMSAGVASDAKPK